jgi:N6-L-threonylcarbamoyladenine synthase
MIILGIESSCDETSAALIHDTELSPEHYGSRDCGGRILAHKVHSQIEDHIIHGGVVPEIAARAHLVKIRPIIHACLEEANLHMDDIDGIAATTGPGLIGGVMVGMMAAKGLALALNKPFIGINHLEGHALTPRLSHDVQFPYLLLLVSGGHTQIILARALGDYKVLGTTLDDAAGECFDKSAKMMGLPYPGGPELEALAAEYASSERFDHGAALKRFDLPRPMRGRQEINFSFSGLKTAVRQHVETIAAQGTHDALPRADMAMLAYAFQEAMVEIFSERINRALSTILDDKALCPEKPSALVIAGGVGANKRIRGALKSLTQTHDLSFIAPPLHLCTDNGAMIAWAGLERMRHGEMSAFDMRARPRWPLEELDTPQKAI